MNSRETLEQKLHQLQSELHRTPGNLWLLRQLQTTQDELDALPEPKAKSKPTPDFVDPVSPPEATQLEGYSTIPMPDVLPPEWARLADPSEGLKISNRRHYGCHQLYNVEENGQLWYTESEKVAAKYNCSPRIIKYAGKRMLNHWYLLPSGRISAVFNGVDTHAGDPEYTVSAPEWPYVDAEKQLWMQMFTKFHFSGAALIMGGHGRNTSHLQYDHIIVNGERISECQIPTVANHPWWILPGLQSYFNTGQHKHRAFEVARGRLFNMDRGALVKDDDYIDWQDYAPDGMGLRDYSEKFEPTATANIPTFEPEPEF